VVVPSIDLDIDAVPAPLVVQGDESTWSVPKFKAGHAEDTAGAGQIGNAVLLGHFESLHSGDVFRYLERVRVGDLVDIYSGEQRFVYRVFDTRAVPRDAVMMVAPTPVSIVSLFTCTGTWDPVAWDFTERFFVRAELVHDRQAVPPWAQSARPY
jgi:LPXTG-site transpeptidase (sortase) family protein